MEPVLVFGLCECDIHMIIFLVSIVQVQQQRLRKTVKRENICTENGFQGRILGPIVLPHTPENCFWLIKK